MPSPNRSSATAFNEELRREQNHNTANLLSYVQLNNPKLNNSTQNSLALALASSGIAAELLRRRRIAHFVLISMKFIETSTCNITKASGVGKVL
ncbi:unnamed protein product [Onchocerca ochengi]|uniref:Uncharacterized protein n=1 Tax=Onchocerca ochengi TaxID=42157 RepID=A0A182EQW7_ONCOC|nr:unnamed protein product [Onchocerca ochengi]